MNLVRTSTKGQKTQKKEIESIKKSKVKNIVIATKSTLE